MYCIMTIIIEQVVPVTKTRDDISGEILHLLLNLAKTVSTRTNNHPNEADLRMSVLWNIDSFIEPDHRSPVMGTTQHTHTHTPPVMTHLDDTPLIQDDTPHANTMVLRRSVSGAIADSILSSELCLPSMCIQVWMTFQLAWCSADKLN